MTKFLAACAALFFAIAGLLVGWQIASTWTQHHTDMVIGAGSVIAGLCAVGLIVLPTALLIARHGARDRREPPVVEPRSDYHTLIDQARYEQAAAQAARARLAAEREGARWMVERQDLQTPMQGQAEQPRGWQPSNGQWIDDVGEGWE